MDTVKTTIDWMFGLGNNPEIHVDSVETTEKLPEYRAIDAGDGQTMYVAFTEDGFVDFLLDVEGNELGYGGATFDLSMEDGSTRTIKGPWSSRCSVLNRLLPEEKHSTEVIWRMQSKAMLISELVKILPEDVMLAKMTDSSGEIYYRVFPKHGTELYETVSRKKPGLFIPFAESEEIEICG